MAKRYSGTLRIRLKFTGDIDQVGRGKYEGNIHIPGYGNWPFSELYVHPVGAYDSPDSYDRVAEAAVDFGGYYGTNNRADAPSWAPSETIAEAIQYEQAFCDDAQVRVNIPGVYMGETALIFRSPEAQDTFHQKVTYRPRPHLTLIIGGANVDAQSASE